jgi:hypothetical protein
MKLAFCDIRACAWLFATGARGAEFKLNLPLGLQKSAAKLLTTIR